MKVKILSGEELLLGWEPLCWTMKLDDSAHFMQLSAEHQCLSYFFAPQLYSPIIVSQSPSNHAVNPQRSNQIEREPGEPRRLSSQATHPIPYHVNQLALSRKFFEWGRLVPDSDRCIFSNICPYAIKSHAQTNYSLPLF